MEISILPNANVDYLDDVLIQNGRIKLLPASEYKRFNSAHLRIWMHKRARYSIPTLELVDWLKQEIKGHKAIEIGSGNGDLAYHLGLVGFDNYCQCSIPEIIDYYKKLGQVPTQPKQDIIKMDAIEAIETHHPSLVIASWVTHKYNGVDGNMYGVDEDKLLKLVDKYIHVGNENIHGRKPITKYEHKTYSFPWILSRTADQKQNVIYVWERHK